MVPAPTTAPVSIAFGFALPLADGKRLAYRSAKKA
jgi:hypothetical protein